MIPCPHCDREFEKRTGLMRHVTTTHQLERPVEPVPVNPGGAIEPVVPVEPGSITLVDASEMTDEQLAALAFERPEPETTTVNLRITDVVVPVPEITPEDEAFVEAYRSVKTVAEPETYAEGLDDLAPGQEPYVDPPVAGPTRADGIFAWDPTTSVVVTTPVRLTMDDTPYVGIDGEARILRGGEPTVNPANGIQSPSPEQYKQIRSLIRSGRSRPEAWLTVVGFEPPPEAPQPPDEMPVRLQQVRNRIYTSRTGQVDQIDARWLLQLAEIGAEAVEALEWSTHIGGVHDGEVTHPEIIERWKQAIQ